MFHEATDTVTFTASLMAPKRLLSFTAAGTRSIQRMDWDLSQVAVFWPAPVLDYSLFAVWAVPHHSLGHSSRPKFLIANSRIQPIAKIQETRAKPVSMNPWNNAPP